MAVTLRCPDCRGKFPWNAKKAWPRHCPLCDADISNDRDDDDVVMPAFISARTKHHDNYYRNMEKGSEFRAEAAAELAGTTASEMSGLKITNLNDRRDAEIAAIPVKNPVSDLMSTGVGGFQGANGVAYSAGVQQGPAPNMGAQMMTKIRGHQTQISGGTAVSDRPALETQQPGYRRRG